MNFSLLRTIKPIEWMLAALLFFAPLYFHPNIGGTGLRIPNNIIIWLIASLIIFYSLYKFTLSQYLYLPRYFIYIVSFPILVWCSGMFAGIEIVEQWFFRLLFIWGGLLFLLGLFQHNLKQGRLDRLIFVLLFSGFFHSLVGLSQIILVDKIPAWLPFNASGMPTGLFQHINNQASFQVTIIILGLWLVSRPFIRHAHIWRFISVIIILSISAFIVGYSGSRVGALGFLLALPLLLISRWRFVKADKYRWIFILVAIVVAITTANTIENKRGLTSVLEKTTAINSGFSGTARLGIYDISVELIKQKPIFGHGIGSFVRVWQYGKPGFYQQHPKATLPSQRVSHPHNETLFWLVEGGLISGSGLLLMLVGIVLSLAKLPHSRRYAYAAFLLPIAIHSQVELPFYISALHWFVFLFLIAVILWPTKKQFQLQLSNAARKSICIVALITLFSSIAFLGHSYVVSNEFKAHMLNKTAVASGFTRAQENPYFKSLALDLMMVRLFEGSMRYGMNDNVQIIADWAEEEIIYNPHILYFKLGTQSYLFLKQHQKACNLATKGNAIYPSDKPLMDVVRKCDE
jgi:O-antigen ligase